MSEINYQLATNIVSRSNQDGTVIIMKMDDSNNFFKINGIAAEIWSGLSSNKTLDSIYVDILKNYDVTAEKLKTDSNLFLNALIEKDLLKMTSL